MNGFGYESLAGRSGCLVSSKAKEFPFLLSVGKTRFKVRVHHFCSSSEDSFLLIEPMDYAYSIPPCRLCCKMMSSCPGELCMYCSLLRDGDRAFWVPIEFFVVGEDNV